MRKILMMKFNTVVLSIILLMLFAARGLEGQNVEVIVTGIRSDKGQIAVGVFLDDKSFQEEKAFLEMKFQKDEITGETMTFSLNLEPGVYGLSLLDDVNSDGRMEYGKLGIPKEGFGFSDYYHTGFKRPKFDSFRFTVLEGQVKKITVRMKYF